MYKAIATAPNEPTKVVSLSDQEVAARELEQSEFISKVLLEHPKVYRDIKMYSPLTINGIQITADDITQQRLTAAHLLASQDPSYTVDWKSDDGFVQLDATQIKSVAAAVSDHVQKCFSAEAAVSSMDNLYTLEAIQEAFDTAYGGAVG